MDDFHKLNLKKLNSATRFHLKKVAFKHPVAVTLTMKQWSGSERLNVYNAQKNMGFFLNRLNYKLFKKGFERNGKRVTVIPVLEDSFSGRLHYHLLIDNPRPEDPKFIDNAIRKCWSNVKFADREICIEDSYDKDGWINYITKDTEPYIDWLNTHRP